VCGKRTENDEAEHDSADEHAGAQQRVEHCERARERAKGRGQDGFGSTTARIEYGAAKQQSDRRVWTSHAIWISQRARALTDGQRLDRHQPRFRTAFSVHAPRRMDDRATQYASDVAWQAPARKARLRWQETIANHTSLTTTHWLTVRPGMAQRLCKMTDPWGSPWP